MAVKLLVIGETKESFFKQSEEEYLVRLKKYVKFSYQTLKSKSKSRSVSELLKHEEELVLKNIGAKDFLVLLDEKGKSYSSRNFAKSLNSWMVSYPDLVFVIGGAFGFSDGIKSRANNLLSMSQMTMPHHLVRTVFLEQIYRALTILNGENYHND